MSDAPTTDREAIAQLAELVDQLALSLAGALDLITGQQNQIDKHKQAIINLIAANRALTKAVRAATGNQ